MLIFIPVQLTMRLDLGSSPKCALDVERLCQFLN
jgi:hypothetical protein